MSNQPYRKGDKIRVLYGERAGQTGTIEKFGWLSPCRWRAHVRFEGETSLETVMDMNLEHEPHFSYPPTNSEWFDQGQQLKAYRETIDMSVRDAAQTLGMSPSVLDAMERGVMKPDMTILERLL